MTFTRTTGIVLTALLALSAIGASVASAAEFKATKSPVMLFGGQVDKHQLVVDGSAVECGTITVEAASVTVPSKTVTVTPSYTKCTVFGFTNGKVEMNGCQYEFLEPNIKLEGNIRLACGGNSMRIFSSFLGSECEVFIGETGNTNLEKVTYKNEATSPTTFKVTTNVGGITATKTKDTGVCPLDKTGTVKNVTYTGSSLVEGTLGIGVSVG